jgi:hypothetical protein
MSSKVPLGFFEPDIYDSNKDTWPSKRNTAGLKQKDKHVISLKKSSGINRHQKLEKLQFKSSKLGGIKPLKSEFLITPSMHRTNFISNNRTIAFNASGLAQERIYPDLKTIEKNAELPNDVNFLPFTPASLLTLPSRGLTATSASSYRQQSTRGSLLYETNIGNNVTTGANIQLKQRRKSALDILFTDDFIDSLGDTDKKDLFDKTVEIDFSTYLYNKSLRRNIMTSSTTDSSSLLSSSSWNSFSGPSADINSRQSDITRVDTATMKGDNEVITTDIMPLSINTIKKINPKMKKMENKAKEVTNTKKSKRAKEIEQTNAINEERERKLMSKEEWQNIIYNNIATRTDNSWRTIKVFISSTFNDMHGERDVINKEVIPDLNELLRCQRIKVIAVDLRWGLTREDTSDAGLGALEHCLHEIDSTRPFFIMLVGERYGWIPAKYRVSDQRKFDWIKKHPPGNSITAMEAYHGFLNNPHRPTHAFCYHRDPSFARNITKKERAVFDFDYPNNTKIKALRQRLLDDIKAHPYCNYRKYRGRYGGRDRYGRPYVTGLQKTFGIPLLKDLYCAIQFHFPKVQNQKRSPPHSRTHASVKNSNKLNINYSNSFQKRQDMAFHDISSGHAHKKFIDYRVMIMINRPKYLQQMHVFLDKWWDNDNKKPSTTDQIDSESKAVLFLTGEPGCGKTSLVCSLIDDYEKNLEKNMVIISFLVGGGPNSNDEESMLRFIGEKLIALFKLKLSFDLNIKYVNILYWFSKIIAAAGAKAIAEDKIILIAIDGIDQIDTSLQSNSFQWIPKHVVEGCLFIISFTTNSELLTLIHENNPHSDNVIVGGLTAAQQRKMIEKILLASHKKLTDKQCQLILQKENASNPLYLQVLCEELILGGQYGIDGSMLDRMISNFPDILENLLSCVLSRIEDDMHDHCRQISLLSPSKSNITGSSMVERAMCFLACSRHGLEEETLQKLIHPGWEYGNKLPEALWARLHRSLAVYLQPRGFQKNSNRLKFYRRELIPAIKKKYFHDSTKLHSTHKDLCRFLTIRYDDVLRACNSSTYNSNVPSNKVIHHFEAENMQDIFDIVYHQIHSIDIKGLKGTLGNLKFIEKCYVTSVVFKNEGVITSLLQFYRTAYYTISTYLPSMRKDLLKLANTNLFDIKWWFEQMWWFLIAHHNQILRSPLLLYQFALNFVSGSAPEKMSRLKSSEKMFYRNDWLWIMRRDTHNIWNVEHAKINIEYELPILIVGKNEIVFASQANLKTCFVSNFGHEKGHNTNSTIDDFFNPGKEQELGEGEKSSNIYTSSIELSSDKQIIVTGTSIGTLKIWSNRKKVCLFETQTVETTLKSSEFKIVNLPIHENSKSSEKYEYVVSSLNNNRTKISFWKVEFTEQYMHNYYKLQEDPAMIDNENNKLQLMKTFPIPQNMEVLSLNTFNCKDERYVILTTINGDDSMLFNIRCKKQDDKICLIAKNNKFNTENTILDKERKIYGILENTRGVISIANFERLSIVATGTLYGKLNIWKTDTINVHDDGMKAVNNKEKKQTLNSTISHNVGGGILVLSWHDSKTLHAPILICANQQKGISIWKYSAAAHQLLPLSSITCRFMKNFSNSFSITDQFIVTTFGNDNKHGCLYLWDLDKLPNLSLDRKCYTGSKDTENTKSTNTKNDRWVDSIFLSSISKYKEIIVSSCISGNGISAATLDGKGDIHVWNTMSNQLSDRLRCKDAVCIGLSTNAYYAVAITNDGAVFLWELLGNYVPHGIIGQLGNNKTITKIVFTEICKRLSVGDGDGYIHLFDLSLKHKINVTQALLAAGTKKADALNSWRHEDSGIRDLKFYSKNCIVDKDLLTLIQEPKDGYLSDNSSGYASDNGSGSDSSDNNTHDETVNGSLDQHTYDIKENFVLGSLSFDGTIKLWSLTSYNILFHQKALFYKKYMKQFMNQARCQSFLFTYSFKRFFFKQTKHRFFEALIAVDTISAENSALEDRLQWYQWNSFSMTGLTNGAKITCLELGFKEMYIVAGFDDGSVNFYSMASKKHTASFVCNASVKSICIPTINSTGFFMVTDAVGQVYPLHINVIDACEKRVSFKVGQAFRNIRSLLKFKMGNKFTNNNANHINSKKKDGLDSKSEPRAYTSKSVHNFFANNSSHHIIKTTINKKNKSICVGQNDEKDIAAEGLEQRFTHNVKLIASVPPHWSPLPGTFNKFLKSFLLHGKVLINENDVFNFITVCGNMSNSLPGLFNRLKLLIKMGLVEATNDHSFILCDGIAEKNLNNIIGKSIDEMRTAIDKCENKMDDEGRIRGPDLIAIVAMEGIVKDNPIRVTYDKKIKHFKAFKKVHGIDARIDKIVNVIGCRRWASRLNALQTICKNLKYNQNKMANGICILISGDLNNLETLQLMMKQKIPIVVIVGSGGIADAIFAFREKSRSKYFGWKQLQSRISNEKSWLSPLEFSSTNSSMLKNKEIVIEKCGNYNNLHLHDISDPPEKLKVLIQRLVEKPLDKMRRAVRRLSNVHRL